MKRLLLALLIVLLSVLALIPSDGGEVLVTRRIHVDAFYHEGVQRPERTDTMSLWIAPSRAVCLVGPVKVIIDADRDILILANGASKTFVEARLSRPAIESMTSDDREATPSHDTTATVRATGETRTVLGRNCRGYALELHANLDHKAVVWVSADVPIDLAAYRALMKKLYAFLGRFDAASADSLLGLPGFVLAQENVAGLKGETLRVNREVIEMSVKTPPAGLFDVPGTFARRPGLTHADVDLIASILE